MELAKSILVGIGVTILAVGGYLLFTNLTSDEGKDSNTEVTEVAEDDAEVAEITEAETEEAEGLAEGYVEYSSENMAAALGTKRVLFFHADWCPTCRAFEQAILEEGVPEGVTILKVDYDSNPDLIQKYGIPVQSYLAFVDDTTELVDSWYTLETETLVDVAKRVGA